MERQVKSSVTTRTLREEEYDVWNKLVTDSPHGSIYSRPEYLDVLCATAGGTFRILGCYKGDELLGGVALYERVGRMGKFVSNRLLLYYNGLVLKAHKSSYPGQRTSRDIELLSALESGLTQSEYGRILLHNRGTFQDVRVFEARGWSVQLSYTYVVPIADMAATIARVDQNLRRLIKRCEDSGVSLTQDDDFDSFYALHADTHSRKGAPLYLPRDAFRRYFERLSSLGLCRLYHARLPGGKSIATQLVLTCSHPVSHSVCAAADAEYLKVGSTPFLRFKVLQDLSALGYTANDLTDAALNPVTKFKSQLGGNLDLTLVIAKTDSFTFRVGETAQRIADLGKAAVRRVISRGGQRELDE
jgi:hypothetical protein